MLKKILLALALAMPGLLFSQPVTLRGKVSDAGTGLPLAGVTVTYATQTLLSGTGGQFEINLTGQTTLFLTFVLDGYEKQQVTVDLPAPEGLEVRMKPTARLRGETAGLSDVSMASIDMETDNQGQYISGLLHSTGDIYLSTAGYTLGAAYFRVRGYDSEYSSVYMNGILVNDPENGRPAWSEWGGLNDATRNKEVVNGLLPAAYGFGDIGGSTFIQTRAGQFGKQQKYSYSLSNRAYNHRLMVTLSTGMMKNNWAFAASVSRRWAEEGYVEGTFYDSWAYFFSAEKKLSDRHSLAFTLYASPTKRGMQGGSTQEVYELTANQYYNPNWGYQDGEKRNARVRKTHEPMFIFSHYWKPGLKTRVTSSLGFTFGRYGTTALSWFNATDPRPDYYRYLPSYQEDTALMTAVAHAWEQDPSVSQINWDRLYQVNLLAKSLGEQSRYILEERRQDNLQLSYNLLINKEINNHVNLSGGLFANRYQSHHFKLIHDLLGGDFYLDVDQFAQRDFAMDTVKMQNDLRNPNRIVKVGDIYGYDYLIRVNSGRIWAQGEFTYNRFDFFAALNLSHTQFWRDGNMQNGRAPDNSYGESEKKTFIDPGVKAGVTFKLTGHHFFQANAAYLSRAPLVRNAFLSPMVKNTYAYDLKSEQNLGGDLSYIYRGLRMNARLTAYQTHFRDQSEIISFYHDDYFTYVNMSLTGIDKVHQGLELGIEWKATSTVSLSYVTGLGNFVYTSRPTAVITVENGSKPDKMETIYAEHFFVNGTPQIAGSAGIRYAHPKYWFFDFDLNYFDKMYLDFNPERRTSFAIDNLGQGDPMIREITRQEKLNHGFTLDASVGKSIRYKQYFINLNLSVSNLLDNQDLITGGYEQMRFDYELKNLGKFPSKYFYAYGRTFFLNVNFRF